VDKRILIVTCLLGTIWASQALAGATASDFRPESKRGANFWNAQSAIDGKPETAWMVPGNSKNSGEYILIEVPKATVDKIGMTVGFALSDETFQDYARVKSVKIEALQQNAALEMVPIPGFQEVSFEDLSGYQIVDIEDIEITGEFGHIKVTVTDVYPGRDYPNFAISEMLLYMGEMDAAPVISGVSSESGGHISMDMVDDNTRTFWAGDIDGAEITFGASGYTLSRVGIRPGPSSYARPKKVEITAVGRTHVQELPNTNTLHWIDIPAVYGYTGSAWGDVQLKILEVYPSTNPQVAISELDLKAVAYEGI